MNSNHEWAPCHSLSMLLSTALLGARVKPVGAGVAWPCLTSHHAAPALPTAPRGPFHCPSCHRVLPYLQLSSLPHLPVNPLTLQTAGFVWFPREPSMPLMRSRLCVAHPPAHVIFHCCTCVRCLTSPSLEALRGRGLHLALLSILSHKLLSYQLGLGEVLSDRKLKIMVT